MFQIVTNNPAVFGSYDGKTTVKYLSGKNQMDVLRAVRDAVHLGAAVETHPIAGSVRPDQTPYCTVLLRLPENSGMQEQATAPLDMMSLTVVEDSLKLAAKYLAAAGPAAKGCSDKILRDFQMIDLELFMHASAPFFRTTGKNSVTHNF